VAFLQRSQVTSSFRIIALLLGALGGAACGATDTEGTGAHSPERQSESEYDLAREYFYKGQPRQALDHIRKAVELNEDNSKALYFTSVIYMSFCDGDQGFKSPDCELSQAEKYATLALKAQEDFRDARNALGQILIHEGRYADAIATIEPLTKDPAYVASHLAWGNLGWAQVLIGQVDDGISSLNNAVAANPKFCVGHYRLGMAYEKKGQLDQAEQALTNAVTVDDPSCTNLQAAWEARGRVRAKLRKPDGAREDFQKCREISDKSSSGRTCVEMLNALPSQSKP
jgi:Tfp pilus assembly protein PilF